MDKVKAILAHKFWILFVLVLPIVAYGYYTASSDIRPAIEKRSSDLKGVSDRAAVNQSATPNETYQVGLKAFADRLSDDNSEVRRDVWVKQLGDMTWPPVVADLMEKNGLRGYRAIEKTEDPLVTLRRKYADTFGAQATELFKSFEPFVGDEFEGKDVDWTQKVLLSPKTLPLPNILPNSNVTAERMWDTQEDIWFVRVLAEVVREMNEEAEGINQAAIRRIDQLKIFGGSGTPELASVGGAGGLGGTEFDDYGGGFDDSAYGGAAASSKTAVDFDPAEEFGPSGEVGSFAGYDEIDYGADFAGGPSTVEPPKRYIGEPSETDLFRERAFYLSLLIDQERLDEFLVELSSARWPVRIARFHIGPNPYFKQALKSVTRPSGGFPGGGFPGGGFPGGGFPGGGFPGGGYPGSETEGYEDYGSEYDEFGGGSGDFGVTSGTAAAISDPIASAAISSPDLIHVAIAGTITLYNEPPVEILGEPTEYPIPVEGQPYAAPKPESEESATDSEAVAMVESQAEVSGTEPVDAASE